MVTKTKRYVNKENLDLIKSFPCTICGASPTDPDHVKTRGSGGGDNLSNLQPLCRRHHVEKGALGVKSFYERYETIIIRFRKENGLPPLQLRWMAN